MTLTAERVREVLNYDPGTGRLTHRIKRGRKRAGEPAGSPTAHGYLQLSIDARAIHAHRVAWLHFYGRWPGGFLDHINGDKTDNRIANLRECSLQENLTNRNGPGPNSKSGFLGVYPNKGAWCAEIKANRRKTYLGRFKTPELAHAAYLAAKRALHPFWAEAA